jgi:glyoxylase-like metal-dependent hydrolase (beta-lactamase superfamily II)
MSYPIDAGDVRCHVLRDGTRPVSPRFVFKGYDDAIHGPFVRDHLDAAGMLDGRLTALLIEAPGGTVLVDAGMGAFGAEMGAGHVQEELTELGVQPWDVRTVVITHGHADHVGGLLGPRGEPIFADARHVIHRAEASYWASEEASALPRDAGVPAASAREALREAGLLDQIDDDVAVGSDVRVLPAPGHTPGHLAVVVAGAFLWAGDAVVSALNVSHPGWVSAADMDGPTNETTRARLLAMAADGSLLLGATHMPAEIRVRRDGDGFAVERS